MSIQRNQHKDQDQKEVEKKTQFWHDNWMVNNLGFVESLCISFDLFNPCRKLIEYARANAVYHVQFELICCRVVSYIQFCHAITAFYISLSLIISKRKVTLRPNVWTASILAINKKKKKKIVSYIGVLSTCGSIHPSIHLVIHPNYTLSTHAYTHNPPPFSFDLHVSPVTLPNVKRKVWCIDGFGSIFVEF